MIIYSAAALFFAFSLIHFLFRKKEDTKPLFLLRISCSLGVIVLLVGYIQTMLVVHYEVKFIECMSCKTRELALYEEQEIIVKNFLNKGFPQTKTSESVINYEAMVSLVEVLLDAKKRINNYDLQKYAYAAKLLWHEHRWISLCWIDTGLIHFAKPSSCRISCEKI